jgi:hypothetical protein
MGLVVVCVRSGREFEARWESGSWFGGKKSAPRRQGGERHRVREIGMVVSCCDSGERGWRTELDLGSRKSLDDHHAAATFGTEPKWAGFLGRGGFWFGL